MKPKDWTHLHPQYAGKWVAFAEDRESVVADAKTLKTLMKRASKKGFKNPIVFKVPQEMVPYVGQVNHRFPIYSPSVSSI
ncbi:MAG: hypothetical protein A2785_04285 [Candidatus Chisholmbacteria bacterium RIFCSPHIGHO2_01_FULL_49_18]|uniref:DUF5678 domain-containing protein n=2 Tax=Candidatus Chisholmiibacteriota TaxID=1817900 RepID=A0A1G1VP83_9BACT|nr:MAG: hypothetical protein A2785_04285 [Candidatus Chisholmbacteria bacterium RIFCSPHIGHO2_01_FULL_49_18]OGY22543.1 MAG: hypothetical protein A3A65_00950 [Candidatus Chisholmbacteria bacterium RIFCSPLOWO2_01_FULL_49_14]